MNAVELPQLTPINRAIIIAVAIFFVGGFAFYGFFSTFAYSLPHAMKGHVYSLLTYPFLSNGFFDALLNSLMLWLMGSEFERTWGAKRYTAFLLVSVLGAALIFSAMGLFLPMGNFALRGLSGLVSALCMAYAVIFPDRIFAFAMIIPIKAKYFGWILALVSLYQGLSGPYGAGSWGHLGALLSAYGFMVWVSRPVAKKKSKTKLKLVTKSEDSDKSTYWH